MAAMGYFSRQPRETLEHESMKKKMLRVVKNGTDSSINNNDQVICQFNALKSKSK